MFYPSNYYESSADFVPPDFHMNLKVADACNTIKEFAGAFTCAGVIHSAAGLVFGFTSEFPPRCDTLNGSSLAICKKKFRIYRTGGSRYHTKVSKGLENNV